MPPNPGLRRGLKKEWGLVARKSPCLELSFEKKENELYPLNCRVGRFESAAEGGVSGGSRGGTRAQNIFKAKKFSCQKRLQKNGYGNRGQFCMK